jgi:ABC-type transporter Mla subunit MlaD
MFVELDRIESGEEVETLKLDFPTPYKVIPSKPSDISQIMRGIDEVITQVKELDLGGISERIKKTLDGASETLDNINQAMADAEIQEISEGIQKTLADVNSILEPERWNRIVDSVEKTVGSMDELLVDADDTVATAGTAVSRVDGILSENRKTIDQALGNFARAMENANEFLKEGTALAGRADASVADLRRYLTNTAQTLQRASENLERVTDSLADQPSQLLFGDAPPRREIPEP